MNKKCMADVTFEEFDDWCNRRACDGMWSMAVAMVCIEAVTEVLAVKPLFSRKKAREKKWQDIKQDYFNLDAEIEV